MAVTSDSAYLAWNDALAARFFCPEAAGQAVHLFVTDEVVREAGRSSGGGLEEFVAAVADDTPGATRAGHCQRALQVAEGWRNRGFIRVVGRHDVPTFRQGAEGVRGAPPTTAKTRLGPGRRHGSFHHQGRVLAPIAIVTLH
jgi:hypothetical protein